MTNEKKENHAKIKREFPNNENKKTVFLCKANVKNNNKNTGSIGGKIPREFQNNNNNHNNNRKNMSNDNEFRRK